jgi:osmotically-inducible protein OsmY
MSACLSARSRAAVGLVMTASCRRIPLSRLRDFRRRREFLHGPPAAGGRLRARKAPGRWNAFGIGEVKRNCAMPTPTFVSVNAQTRDAVIQQLEWDSQLDATDVGVTARGGVVTLTGFIDSYAGKLAAERAAKRVRGVRAVANDIQVRLTLEQSDPEIARGIDAALRSRFAIPASVQASVHQGHVSLTGTTPTYFIRALAAETVLGTRGVRDVSNHIRVEPPAAVRDVRRLIVQALHRSAEVNARNIDVVVDGSHVRLTGEVASWAEIEAVESAVAHATGVTQVDNDLTIAPPAVPATAGGHGIA